ncbi:MAG: hypothetical protein HZB83_00440 [Deltaproteobacteria bacterium]|nr:hypothetical protein [Deltaproteobacteria bacterium]
MSKVFVFILVFFLSSSAWAKDGIDTLISPGGLAGAHAKYEGIRNCTKCHKLGGGIPDSTCLDCHDKLAAKINKKQGIHAKFTETCIKCHSDHKGRNYKMASVDKDKFNHDRTEYPLKDKHAQVKCDKCHKKEGVYTGLKQDCLSCHNDYHKKQLDADCEKCHNIKGWKDVARFNHNTASKYGLTGKHLDVKCAKCHAQGKYKPIAYKACTDCHKDEHKGQFKGRTCESCHTIKGWKTLEFEHNAPEYKGYKLEGKHLDVKCAKCHAEGKYKPIA